MSTKMNYSAAHKRLKRDRNDHDLRSNRILRTDPEDDPKAALKARSAAQFYLGSSRPRSISAIQGMANRRKNVITLTTLSCLEE